MRFRIGPTLSESESTIPLGAEDDMFKQRRPRICAAIGCVELRHANLRRRKISKTAKPDPAIEVERET